MIQFQPKDGQINLKIIKDWTKSFLSDFTLKITSKKQFETLINNPIEKDINKVVIFSKKEKLSDQVKAISAEFRDKLRFFVIALPEGKQLQ